MEARVDEIAPQIFRIAVMGDLDGRDLERLAAALRSALS